MSKFILKALFFISFIILVILILFTLYLFWLLFDIWNCLYLLKQENASCLIILLNKSISINKSDFVSFNNGIFSLINSFGIIMAFLTILQTALYYGISTITKKQDEKLIRTNEYINKWREESVYNHFAEIGNIFVELKKDYPDIFDKEHPYPVPPDKEEAFYECFRDYIWDEPNDKNKGKRYSFTYVMNFWQQLAILINNDVIDNKLVKELLYDDIKDTWDKCKIFCKKERHYNTIFKDINEMFEEWEK